MNFINITFASIEFILYGFVIYKSFHESILPLILFLFLIIAIGFSIRSMRGVISIHQFCLSYLPSLILLLMMIIGSFDPREKEMSFPMVGWIPLYLIANLPFSLISLLFRFKK